MKTFRAFLLEIEKTITAHSAGVEHKFDVGPHRVHVRFSQHKPGEYTANFRVNGSMEKYDNPNIKPAHRAAIVHHVVGSVKQFVKSHKPTSLRASGNTAKKQLLYHKLWHHIAKNHPDYEAHSHGIKRRDLSEAWHSSMPSPYKAHAGKHVDIHKNPSKQELHKIIHGSEAKRARVILHGHDAYAWDAMHAVHDDVREHLKLGPYTYHKRQGYIDIGKDRIGTEYSGGDGTKHISDHPWIKKVASDKRIFHS
jgi:hypothetical protein